MASRYAGIVSLALLVVVTASCNALLDIQEYPAGSADAGAGRDATATATVDAAPDQSSSDALAEANDGCGVTCSGGKTCQGGGCACPGGTHDCSGTCSSNSSTASCGTTSCVACSAPTNGTATCDGSACGISCSSGFSQCGSTCVDETQNGNCGGCGVTCAIRCTSSACVSAKAIAVGLNYACAVLSDGSVECWGANEVGQLGYTCPSGDSSCLLLGPSMLSDATLPHVVPGVSGAVSVSAPSAGQHTCVVLANGQVMCWGENGYGQLGYSSTDCAGSNPACSKTAHLVPGITNAVAVATGQYFTCALLSDHTVVCWGDNSLGNLGNGTLTASTSPVQVSNLSTAIAISAGSASACALRSNGTIACWGDNTYDELGVETAATPSVVSCDSGGDVCSSTPVSVFNITQATAIADDDWMSTCALIGGNVQCWGDNSSGLGDQAGTTETFDPVSVWGVGSATSIVSGYGTACALLSDGTAACWGNGPFGDGTNSSSTTRVVVMGLSNATAMAPGGGSTTCAILSTGGVSCFSSNGSGQLGNGTTVPSYTLTPVVW